MLFNERSLKSLRALRGQAEARLRPELAKIAVALNLGRQLGKHRVVSREDIETLVTHARRETGWDFETELEGQGRLETATDNEKLQAEGEAQQLKGTGQDVKGSVKGALGDKI